MTLGQFTHGGVGGLTRATLIMPVATQYFNNYMTKQGATEPRSSLTIGMNNRISYHRDIHNVGSNCTISLGKFSGGELWLEDRAGPSLRQVQPARWVAGRQHSTHHRLLRFSPRAFHGVEPHQGERWSLTTFQTRSSVKLSGSGQAQLGALGFNLRGYGGELREGQGRDLALLDSSFCASLTHYWALSLDRGESGASTYVELDEEEEITSGSSPGTTGIEPRPRPRISEEQKRLVKKLHINTGHPPPDRFLRTMRAAGALPHVLEYIRDHFRCDDCDVKVQADSRRRAQCPRLYAFNKVLSMDIMYLRFQEAQIPILNMVCTGTNYHVAVRILDANGTPTSSATWKHFLETWVRYIGAPNLVITDGGNEFKGAFERFERGLEQLGCLQHVCAAESPWQNAKSERHGGWLKRRLTQEVESGRCIFDTLSELDEFLAQITAAKNRWFNQDGYSPGQLVFGELPRVSAELLNDGPGGLQPLSDALHDPAGGDEVGVEFRRRMTIRDRARQLAMEAGSKEAVEKALKTRTSPTRKWNLGQWVYVFRRAKPGDSLHPTSRVWSS